jgi:hypothetical protein
MRCSQCGRQFHGGETNTYRYDRVGDGYLRMLPMILCPDCAAGQRSILKWFLFFFVLLVIGMLLIRAMGF